MATTTLTAAKSPCELCSRFHRDTTSATSIKFALVLNTAMITIGCAGRAPAPVPIVQIADRYTNCAAITAEVEANNQRISELGEEKGAKLTQNIIVGIAGAFIPILWFGMDFQGAASTEQEALQGRQQYLASLAQDRCSSPSIARMP